MAKFHVKAIALYGVSQNSEGKSAIQGAQKTGTAGIALDDTIMVISSGQAETELKKGQTIYKLDGTKVCKIVSVDSDTNITTTPASVALSGDPFTNEP